MAKLEGRGSIGVGLVEILGGAGLGLGAAVNGFRGFADASVGFGGTREITWNNTGNLFVQELQLLVGSTFGQVSDWIPREFWIGENVNHLTAANWSTLSMLGFAALAIHGFKDLGRGIQDIGGRDH